MTEFDDLMDYRLPNWGRWGRISDCPNPNIPSHIADLLGKSHGTTEGHGETEAGEEAASFVEDDKIMPIFAADAESLDFMIRQLSRIHLVVLRQRFYRFKPVSVVNLNEAIYALIDTMRANRDTVKKMRKLGAA